MQTGGSLRSLGNVVFVIVTVPLTVVIGMLARAVVAVGVEVLVTDAAPSAVFTGLEQASSKYSIRRSSAAGSLAYTVYRRCQGRLVVTFSKADFKPQVRLAWSHWNATHATFRRHWLPQTPAVPTTAFPKAPPIANPTLGGW